MCVVCERLQRSEDGSCYRALTSGWRRLLLLCEGICIIESQVCGYVVHRFLFFKFSRFIFCIGPFSKFRERGFEIFRSFSPSQSETTSEKNKCYIPWLCTKHKLELPEPLIKKIKKSNAPRNSSDRPTVSIIRSSAALTRSCVILPIDDCTRQCFIEPVATAHNIYRATVYSHSLEYQARIVNRARNSAVLYRG